jgi:hypothetical protein
MRTNAAITIYNRYIDASTRTERWQRSQILGVAWENRKASNVIASGGKISADQATIFIPMPGKATYLDPIAWQDLRSGHWTLQIGDIIVKGLVSDTLQPAVVSPPQIAFTVSDLKAAHDYVLTISSVDPMDSGSYTMWHWKVGAV